MYWSPKTRHRPSDGSGGGCRFVNSSGKPGMRTTDEEAWSLAPPANTLRSSSIRATLSGVKSFQKGGGLGNVDASECGSCSAIAECVLQGGISRHGRIGVEVQPSRLPFTCCAG